MPKSKNNTVLKAVFFSFLFLVSQQLFSQNTSNDYTHYTEKNQDIMIRDIDCKYYGPKYLDNLQYIEEKLLDSKYDDYYRVYNTDMKRKGYKIYIYLIPKNSTTPENWKKYKNPFFHKGKVIGFYFDTTTQKISGPRDQYIIPSW